MNKIRVSSDVREIPVEFTWTIKKFAERQTVTEPGQEMLSPEVTITDPAAGEKDAKSYSFQLKACIKGSKDKPESFKLFLWRTNKDVNIIEQSNGPVKMKFTFFFLDELGKRVNERIETGWFKMNCSWGYINFYPLSKLESNEDKVIASNSLTIGCEFVILIDRDAANDEHKEVKEEPMLGEQLFSQTKEGALTDLTLVCGDKRLPCHKAVLAAQSPVFKDLFENSKDEAELTIDDVMPEVLEKTLEFVYLGKVEIGDDATDLFKAGDKYNLAGLKQHSERALLQSLTPTTAAETLILLNVHGCEADTAQAACRFVARHLSEVMQTEAWSRVVAMHPTVVNGVFKEMPCFS